LAVSAVLSAQSPARASEPTLAPPPALFLSLEGGAACQFGQEINAAPALDFVAGLHDFTVTSSNYKFGGNECGWTGRIGIGQDNLNAFGGLLDYWGVFVRQTDFGKDRFSASGAAFYTPDPTYYGQGSADGTYKEKRTVVDFEVGQDIGIGSGTRIFGGLRYARFRGDARIDGTYVYYDPTPYTYAFSANHKFEFSGIGPRIGLAARVPLQGCFGLLFMGSASALYGDRVTKFQFSVPGFSAGGLKETDTGWVTNLEGETGLTFAVSPSAELVAGVRVEAWFDQIASGTAVNSADRDNWGPFGRLVVKFDNP
jgi:hypothetical protein